MQQTLDGWDIGTFDQLEWASWGSRGDARAKVLANADGYVVTLVEAQPGYQGDPHVHAHAEFLYVIDGALRTQGKEMRKGDAYAAAAGSTHSDFATETGATYLLTFKL